MAQQVRPLLANAHIYDPFVDIKHPDTAKSFFSDRRIKEICNEQHIEIEFATSDNQHDVSDGWFITPEQKSQHKYRSMTYKRDGHSYLSFDITRAKHISYKVGDNRWYLLSGNSTDSTIQGARTFTHFYAIEEDIALREGWVSPDDTPATHHRHILLLDPSDTQYHHPDLNPFFHSIVPIPQQIQFAPNAPPTTTIATI